MPVTDSIVRRVAVTAARERMFRKNGRVLVAVSGGPDSLVCLWVILHLRQQFGFEVVAAHFDHQLRPDSAADLEFVRDLCVRLEIECRTGEGDVAAMARDTGRGIEDAARQMRYQFLAFVAGREMCESVATGHTADDQAETVLQRILRGTGVRGIRGMLPVATVPGSPAIGLVRPLLEVTRAETEAICREAGLEPRTDPSNAGSAYQRNRIRHTVLPALREVAPGVDDSLRGLAESARELFASVERRAMEVQPTSRGPEGCIFEVAKLRALPSEALTLVLEREATFIKAEVEMTRTRLHNLQSVLKSGTGRVAVGPDAEVEVSCGLARFGHPFEPGAATPPFEPKILNVPGTTLAGPYRIDVRTDPVEGATIIPAGDITGVLRARLAQPGDRIRIRGHHKKLSDALAQARVPTWRRHNILVITDSSSVIAVPTEPALSPTPPPDTDDVISIQIHQTEART